MYEDSSQSPETTHDDLYRAARPHRELEQIPAFSGLVEGGTVTGIGFGMSECPGPNWARLRWAELARRRGVVLWSRPMPDHEVFGFKSWPANIAPPSEGSIDREQFDRLVEHLRNHSGGDMRCLCYFSMYPLGNDEPTVLRGTLDEVAEIYDDDEFTFTPTNMWPEDRSWFVYSDYDLAASKISGSRTLMDALEEDPVLETLDNMIFRH